MAESRLDQNSQKEQNMSSWWKSPEVAMSSFLSTSHLFSVHYEVDTGCLLQSTSVCLCGVGKSWAIAIFYYIVQSGVVMYEGVIKVEYVIFLHNPTISVRSAVEKQLLLEEFCSSKKVLLVYLCSSFCIECIEPSPVTALLHWFDWWAEQIKFVLYIG